MRLWRTIIGGGILGVWAAGASVGQEAIDNPGRLLASNCYQCHGTNGRRVAGGFEGLDAGEIVSELREMMGSTLFIGEEGIMKVHAKAYSLAEVSLIAAYLEISTNFGSGAAGNSDGGDREETVNSSQRLKLEIKGERYGSVVSGPSGIDCSGRCDEDEASFETNTVVALTAVPESERGFVGWSGACSGNAKTCLITMSRKQEVKAIFSRNPTANPSGGSPGGSDENGGGSANEPSDDHDDREEVVNSSQRLKLEIKGERYGSVVSGPSGIDCSGRCDEDEASFETGTVVTLTAVPEPGRKFSGWSGDCRGRQLTCQVSISRKRAVKATFGR